MKSAPKVASSVCKAIILGGEAGEGVKSAGQILALSLIKTGNNVFVYDEYPSLIRGGHNSVNVTYSPDPVYAANREIDILVCLNRETFDEHKKDLIAGSIVLYDQHQFKIDNEDLADCPCELVEVPVLDILKRTKLNHITKNTIMVAAALCVAGVDKDLVKKVLTKTFKKKLEVLEMNYLAIEEGYDNSIEYFGIKKFEKNRETEKKILKTKKYLMDGNQSLSMGSIRAGIQFYAAYPMTPASTILDFMSANFREYDFVVKQVEDEIAAINMAIGAAFAGARSMVGTAGGGFSLMVEGLGLAAITETPLVIVIAQRPGPATGLPTWTGQGDLMFALHASQDEFPRIVLTPTDAEECFTMAFESFNLAEKYQLPVIIMTDRYMAESMHLISIDVKKNSKIDRGLLMTDRLLNRIPDFNRFEFTASGISPRSIPGQKNGIFLANSDEGDTKGYTNETSENRINKMKKRFKKVELIKKDMPELNVYGDIRAKTCLMTWGSTKGPALEAMRRLQSMGISTKLLALNYIEPFPTEEIEKFIKSSKKTVLIEGNYTSQLGKLITMNTGYDIEHKLLKYDGRPIYPDEIVNFVSKL